MGRLRTEGKKIVVASLELILSYHHLAFFLCIKERMFCCCFQLCEIVLVATMSFVRPTTITGVRNKIWREVRYKLGR